LSKLFKQISHSRKKVVACISIFAHLPEISRSANKKPPHFAPPEALLPSPGQLG
jgi:hypothetical protein